MIRAIVFDLDNCLASADEIGREVLEPMFEAIRQANRGLLSDATLESAFADCWRLPLDAVAEKYEFSDDMLAAGWHVGRTLAVAAPMRGYSDLRVLPELPVKRFLVTSGFRRLQESKVDALGLRSHFERVYIDAIDEPGRTGKLGIFRRILSEHQLDPARVLVVGDNPESEIDAGNRLGMTTVQILRPGVQRGTNAKHYIRNLRELRDLLPPP